MERRRLGQTGIEVTPIGFGAFKIGRNVATKYPHRYPLPDEEQAVTLLNAVLDMNINLIDTAPAYGLSEERIGRAISHRRDEFVLCTKAGEEFADGESTFDYSQPSLELSIARSLQRLQTDYVDILLIHSDGNDRAILRDSDAVPTVQRAKSRGQARTIGFSGKSVAGARLALEWADVIMVEYHIDDRSHERVINEAAERGVGVLVKKGLRSGHLPAHDAIHFVLSNPNVSSMVIGGLNIDHLRDNIAAASTAVAQQ